MKTQVEKSDVLRGGYYLNLVTKKLTRTLYSFTKFMHFLSVRRYSLLDRLDFSSLVFIAATASRFHRDYNTILSDRVFAVLSEVLLIELKTL